MGRKSNKIKTWAEDLVVDSRMDKKCPLGWRVEIDSEDDPIKVKFIYLAHNRVDTDFHPTEYKFDYSFDKQEMISLIPETACSDPFYLVNYAGALEKRRWEIIQYITQNLAEDFEEIQANTKSAAQMYNGIARVFSSNKKYQRPLEALVRQEVLLHILRKPKTSQEDIRKGM